MGRQNREINALFASIVVLLAAAAVTGMYLNRDRPPVLEAASGPSPGAGELPESHPPIGAAAQIAAMEQASLNDPQNAGLKTQIGNAYYDAGEYPKAIAAYQASLKLKPQDPNVETDLATCYHALGQHDAALDLLGHVLQYQPGFAQALFNKAIILQLGKNDAPGAAAALEELLRTNPGYPQRADVEERIRQLRSPKK